MQSPLDPLKSRRRQHTLQIKHWQCQKCSPRSQRVTAGNIFHLCSSYSKLTVMEFIAFHFNKTLCLSLSLSHIRSSSYWLSSPALHHPNQAGAVAKFSNQTTWIACVTALLVSGLTIEIGAIGWQKKERGQIGLQIVRRWSSHGRWWLICSC